MKKLIMILIMTTLFVNTQSSGGIDNLKSNMPLAISTKSIIKKSVKPVKVTTVDNFLSCNDGFLNAIGHLESRNNYNITNKFGYIGRYQFSTNTIRGLDYNVTKTQFLNDSILQEEVMWSYMKYHKEILDEYIEEYNGTYLCDTIYNDSTYTVDSLYITTSGILGAAHLSGAGNVQKFFKSNGERNFADAFGTSIKKYLRLLSGYPIFV